MSRSLDLLTEVCGSLPKTVKRMFGGYGFFAPNGGMFAGIVTDDEVILKLEDEQARAELVAEGGHPWVYQARDRAMTMASWIVVPEAFYDDLERFSVWARRAHALVPGKLAAARSAPKAKSTGTRPAATKSKPTAKAPRSAPRSRAVRPRGR